MKTTFLFFIMLLSILACKEQTESIQKNVEIFEEKVTKSAKKLRQELTEKGYQTFDYVDAKTQDTIIMQQYFIAFLKARSKSYTKRRRGSTITRKTFSAFGENVRVRVCRYFRPLWR